jgi:DNA repair protein RecN (Recombination protein N)
MLVDLTVRNLALIEEARLSFGPGLNAITGETGAGKSLIVTALELLLGERPRGGAAPWIREGAQRAEVEGRFVLADPRLAARVDGFVRQELPAFVAEWDEELAAGAADGAAGAPYREVVLSRTLEADGRTRAWINHRPVTRRVLGSLAGVLVEIHGQQSAPRLLEPEQQAALLDAFGELGAVRSAYDGAREAWLRRAGELRERLDRRAERCARLEFLRFQRRELEALEPRAGEVEGLRSERERLRHGAALGRDAAGWLDGLSEGDEAALDRLRSVCRGVDHWSQRVTELRAVAEELDAARLHLEEASGLLLSFQQDVELDPARLEWVEERLAGYERLALKHGVPAGQLVSVVEGLDRELEQLESEASGNDELARARAVALEALRVAAEELSAGRAAAVAPLVRAVTRSLAGLGLGRARFEVVLTPAGREARGCAGLGEGGAAASGPALASLDALERAAFGPHGSERVEFLLAANPGEPLLPLRQVASGGEAARLLLALRTALAGCEEPRALVFDEIDAGVGGRLGPALARHLRSLGEHHQVLTVTHLPAIAAAAHRHQGVRKAVRRGRTRTAVALLEGEARVLEVADMISGGAEQPTAQAEARRLLESAAG